MASNDPAKVDPTITGVTTNAKDAPKDAPKVGDEYVVQRQGETREDYLTRLNTYAATRRSQFDPEP